VSTIKKRLRTTAIVFSVILALYALLIGWGAVMGYNMIYVEVPWATFAVNGKPSSDFSLYEEVRRDSLVVSRGPLWNREMYVVGHTKRRLEPDRPAKSSVITCAPSALTTLPGILIQNHEQMCATFVILGPDDPPPAKGPDRQLKVGDKAFEFVGNDGRRIGAKW